MPCGLPPLSVHSLSEVVTTYPWPLQEFCPGPGLLAVLHALFPEQSLPPTHLTLAACAVVDEPPEFCAWRLVPANAIATAPARIAPESTFFFIIMPLLRKALRSAGEIRASVAAY